MTRRSFIGGMTAAAGLTGVAADNQGSGAAEAGSVKFCLFADLHYVPKCFPHDDYGFIDKIIARAKAEKVDFIMHLGDLIHRAKEPKEIAFIKHYNECGLPAYHTIGNHENDGSTEQETLAAFGLKCGHYYFEAKGFRFIICDCNYIRRGNGKLEHYEKGNYFERDRKRDLISYMPEEQIEWLKATIESASGPCVVCSHQSFERERGSVPNWRAVREVLEAANRKRPGHVCLVMNGHHHCDYFRILNGIPYFDVNSANYVWHDDAHQSYPEEYVKAHSFAAHTLTWNEPLSAIVTLSKDGHIRVEGAKSSWWLGITPEQAKVAPLDEIGRPDTTQIQSFDLRLKHGI